MIDFALQDGIIRVLLIEDDEDDYVLTKGLLNSIFQDRCRLQWARGFDEGLSRIIDEPYDVALVDYRLGVRDGVQLIREARAKGCRQSIILMTGQDDREVDLAATRAGASDFLSKTEVTSAMLERAIRYSMQAANLEEQRVRLLAERAARAEAEAGSRAKDRFLATLSHELRTPLTPVMMAVTAMSNEQSLPPALRQDLDMIRRNIELEARLIDDLLDITRVTRGTLQLRLALVDVHQKLRDALRLCEPEIRERGHTVTLNLDAAEARIKGDPARVQQILWNLLNNAVKYTPPGGIIKIETAQARTAQADGAIVICVSDNGIGIEPTLLPRLFDAFEQGVRAEGNEINGGLGLGLAISKALADLHGGNLTAASEGPGKGAILTLRLPLAAAKPAPASPAPASQVSAATASRAPSPASPLPAAPASPPPEQRGGAGGAGGGGAGGGGEAQGRKERKPRLLFVEDHVDTAMALMRVLKRQGYDVQTSRTVAEAVERIEANPFDLLISDIGLPDGTGLDLMRKVRSLGKSIPAIAVSGYGMVEDVESARQAGFARHMTKPVHPDTLLETVRAMLEAVVAVDEGGAAG